MSVGSEPASTTATVSRLLAPHPRHHYFLRHRKRASRKSTEVNENIKRMGVRRNLFGPVDHHSTDNFLRRQLASADESARCKWNFDFSEEKPLQGRWFWQPVGEGDPDIPSVYGNLLRLSRFKEDSADKEREDMFSPITEVTDRSSMDSCGHASFGKPTCCADDAEDCAMDVLTSRGDEVDSGQILMQPSLNSFLPVKKRRLCLDEKLPRGDLTSRISDAPLHTVCQESRQDSLS